jgi:hypothetical protein
VTISWRQSLMLRQAQHERVFLCPFALSVSKGLEQTDVNVLLRPLVPFTDLFV